MLWTGEENDQLSEDVWILRMYQEKSELGAGPRKKVFTKVQMGGLQTRA